MTSTYTPIDVVAEAIYGLLSSDATLLALAVGGVFTDVPPSPSFPFLWIEVLESQQLGGFGTKPGQGALPEIEIRLHVFSEYQGMGELAKIVRQAMALLYVDNAIVVTGYKVCGTVPFHDGAIPLNDELLSGIKVKELVSRHRLYIEEQ